MKKFEELIKLQQAIYKDACKSDGKNDEKEAYDMLVYLLETGNEKYDIVVKQHIL